MIKVYYAHSMQTYGTNREKRDLDYLRGIFRHVICPNNDIGELGAMQPYLTIVDHCDMVIASSFEQGYFSKGVCKEVQRAIATQKDCLLMRWSSPDDKEPSFLYINKAWIFDESDTRIRYGKYELSGTGKVFIPEIGKFL